MYGSHFHTDRKKIDEFQILEKRGKVKINISVYEQWENISMRDISCGEKYTKRFERRIGIQKEVKEDLESLIKGRVGIKGLANIESEIKSKVSLSFCFDHWIHETEEREIFAPKCGKRIIDIWQKSRVYFIEIIDSRIFSTYKGYQKQSFCEYLDFFHDHTIVDKYDPICNCGDRVVTLEDGIFEILIGDKVSLLSPFRKLEDGIVLIENLDLEVSYESLGLMMCGEYSLDFELIPPHINFIADLKDCNCKVVIRNHNLNSINFDYSMEKYSQALMSLREYPYGNRSGRRPFIHSWETGDPTRHAFFQLEDDDDDLKDNPWFGQRNVPPALIEKYFEQRRKR